MDSAFLSNIELYYIPAERANSGVMTLDGDEFQHITRVMRHSVNDKIYLTDGAGHIFLCRIEELSKKDIKLERLEKLSYANRLSNVFFCIPKLKNPERFEFALEKSVELGITNFIVYDAEKGVAKGDKTDRWQKILISGMKQSLRSYLPQLRCIKSLKDLSVLEGQKVVFEQLGSRKFIEFTGLKDVTYYFIFGPEGGLSDREISYLSDAEEYSLTGNRLRAETAVITAASILALK
ncbi:MAG: RsmE family RNA methyltransferase [Bacillota bacterium]